MREGGREWFVRLAARHGTPGGRLREGGGGAGEETRRLDPTDACARPTSQDPTCAKLVVSGSLLPVPAEDAADVVAMIAARHPEVKEWPANHGFAPYELHIDSMGLLDFYGAPPRLRRPRPNRTRAGAA